MNRFSEVAFLCSKSVISPTCKR